MSAGNLPTNLVCTGVRFGPVFRISKIQTSLVTTKTYQKPHDHLSFVSLGLGLGFGPWPMEGYFSEFPLFNSEQKVGLFGEVTPQKRNKIHNHQC